MHDSNVGGMEQSQLVCAGNQACNFDRFSNLSKKFSNFSISDHRPEVKDASDRIGGMRPYSKESILNRILAIWSSINEVNQQITYEDFDATNSKTEVGEPQHVVTVRIGDYIQIQNDVTR